MGKKGYLILGNGAAGITAAGKLRELSSIDDVTVIGSEDVIAYTKIMLPDYIGGKIGREKLFIRDRTYYEHNNIKLELGCRVTGIDTSNRRVELADGRKHYYDSLLIAVGGIPFVPDIEGLDRAEYFTINSLRDADVIIQKASESRKAVIMGGGLTGIEMAFALNRLGMEVYIVEKADRILPAQLDGDASDIMIRELARAGIKVITGSSVRYVISGVPAGSSNENSGYKKCVQLTGGLEIPYDMLITSIGTRSNTDFVKGTAIKCGRGILVDSFLKTSLENVYAAGDVAEAADKLPGEYVSSYIWPNAMNQGKCAAFNMTGQQQEFSFSAGTLNAVQLRDMPFNSVGLVNPKGDECEVLIRADKNRGIYKKLVLKDNVVKGMTLIGDVSQARALTGLVRSGSNVSEVKHRLLNE